MPFLDYMGEDGRGSALLPKQQRAHDKVEQSTPRLRMFDAPTRSGPSPARARLLVVDDEPEFLRTMTRTFAAWGYEVMTAKTGSEAISSVIGNAFDAIVCDILMPQMDGIQLLREVKSHDPQVPVVLITAEPALDTAVRAVESGAFRYLRKDVALDELRQVLDKAVRTSRLARLEKQAGRFFSDSEAMGSLPVGLEASFEQAMQSLWVAYQPIVNYSKQTIFGYEALLRSDEPKLPHPGAVLQAAEQLDSLNTLGRKIRERAALDMQNHVNQALLFINLHVADLLDPTLYEPDAPLSNIADRVVLEITERASLDKVPDALDRVAALRKMGYWIAVDDLGAGYAGLSSFALLEPEIVKLDMSLVRGVHESPTKQKLVRTMTALSQDMGMLVVAEGVETADERNALQSLGCDLLQGFLFARPAWPLPEVRW